MTTTTTIAMTARAATIPPTIAPMVVGGWGLTVVRRKIIMVKKIHHSPLRPTHTKGKNAYVMLTRQHETTGTFWGQAPVSSNRRAVVPHTKLYASCFRSTFAKPEPSKNY